MVLSMSRPQKRGKSGVYYLRKRVPRALLSAVGRKEVWVSLDTKDPERAKVLHREKETELAAKWSRMDAGPQYLDDEQVEAIAGEIYRARLAQFGKVRSFPAANHHWVLVRITCDAADGTVATPSMTPERALRFHAREVDERLARSGLKVDEDTHHRLLVATNRALKQAAALYMRQMDGDWTPDPKADRFPSLRLPEPDKPVMPQKPAVEVEDFWEKVSAGYSAGTQKRWRAILNRLLASAAITDLSLVTESHVEAWRDAALVSGKVTARTFANNDLTAIKTIFKRAVKRKLVSVNPAQNVTVEEAHKQVGKAMRDIYDEEAILVLTKTLQPQSPRLAKHNAAARRWVPWLCAYTGARVNEITQTCAEHVRNVDGYWCIWITPDAGTTKNRRARYVPLHEHLIAQGFLDFVKTHAGSDRLFAAVEDGDLTTAAQVTGGHLAGWVRKVLKDPSVAPNHGWRHRFETEARFHMQEMFVDAIQGHAGKTQGRKYGHFPPRVLGPLIAKMPRQPVDVPGTPPPPPPRSIAAVGDISPAAHV